MSQGYQTGHFYCEQGFVGRLSYIRGQSSAEIERRIGYRAGRLSGGWALLVLLRKPEPAEFELAGYSQLSDGMFGGQLPSGAPVRVSVDADARSRDSAADARYGTGYSILKRNARQAMEIGGPDCVVKVIPQMPHIGSMPRDEQYPAGSGVPQWRLCAKLPFICATLVPAGSSYSGGGAGLPKPEAWWSPANIPTCC
jgi:hypothetical protein